MNATASTSFNIWDNLRGSFDSIIFCKRPVPPSAVWKNIGDVCLTTSPLAVLAEVPPSIPEYAESSPLLKAPVDFVKVWSSQGSSAPRVNDKSLKFSFFQAGSFWEPVCPDGYFAIGHIAHNFHDMKPAFSATNCVHARCVQKCVPSRSFWNDRGSGAPTDVTLFLATESSPDTAFYYNFFALPAYYNSISSVPASKFYCLASKCLTGLILNVIQPNERPRQADQLHATERSCFVCATGPGYPSRSCSNDRSANHWRTHHRSTYHWCRFADFRLHDFLCYSCLCQHIGYAGRIPPPINCRSMSKGITAVD